MGIGIDGCKSGWIVVSMTESTIDWLFIRTIEDIQSILSFPILVLIDMPIGLPSIQNPSRTCDELARSYLLYNKSSIFSPPIREVLHYAHYQEANSFQKLHVQKGFSIQSWNIVPKIKELDTFLENKPALQEHFFESHPELCFQRIGQKKLPSKRTAAGIEERRLMLTQLHPNFQDCYLNFLKSSSRHFIVDFLDAAILAWVATHHQENLLFLPEIETRDSTGKRMQIVTIN